ncbi:MAG: hypothetical protein P4L46_22860 [Fimbriimonas sp.]|nr:hypothetical protein [Fimbriimonas sp.]
MEPRSATQFTSASKWAMRIWWSQWDKWHFSKVTSLDLAELGRLTTECDLLLDVIRVNEISRRIILPDSKAISLLARHPTSLELAILFSYSGSGYVRQAAVENLARIGGQSLPYLLLRTCDWVRPVSEYASKTALRSLPLVDDSTLAVCIRVLRVLARYDRLDSPEGCLLLQLIQERPGVLKNVRWSLPIPTILFLLDRNILGPDENSVDVVRRGLLHRDHRVAQRTVQATSRLATSDRHDLLGVLLGSSAKAARLAAAEISADLGLVENLAAMASDRIWRVRTAARTGLERIGPYDFVAYYRDRFPDETAVTGFGEVAPDAQLEELIPFLSSPSAKVRLATIRAFGSRDARQYSAAIANCLNDERPRIVVAAVRVLHGFAYRVSRDAIEGIMAGAVHPKKRKAVYLAFELLPRWDSLIATLEFADRCEDRLAPSEQVQRWLTGTNRDYSGPPRDQLQTARAAFERIRTGLSELAAYGLAAEFAYWSSKLKLD